MEYRVRSLSPQCGVAIILKKNMSKAFSRQIMARQMKPRLLVWDLVNIECLCGKPWWQGKPMVLELGRAHWLPSRPFHGDGSEQKAWRRYSLIGWNTIPRGDAATCVWMQCLILTHNTDTCMGVSEYNTHFDATDIDMVTWPTLSWDQIGLLC